MKHFLFVLEQCIPKMIRQFKIDSAEIPKLANKQWRSISPNVVDAKINHFIATE